MYEYEAAPNSVSFAQLEAHFAYELFDPNCVVKVTSNNQEIAKAEATALLCSSLNYGFTEICLHVTSPDKSTGQVYRVQIVRNANPRLSSLVARDV